jgi:hypothetical protein
MAPLRIVAAIWVMVQMAWLPALLQRDCCAAHHAEAPRCHASVSSTHCPMQDSNGTPCPMHRAAAERKAAEHGVHAGHRDPARPAAPGTDCRLRGTCNGPMAALLSLLSSHGVLSPSFSMAPESAVTLAAPVTEANPLSQLQPPNAPPPRA